MILKGSKASFSSKTSGAEEARPLAIAVAIISTYGTGVD
jgi:hypothetical protein